MVRPAFAIACALTLSVFAAPGKLVDVGGRNLHLLCIGSGSPTVVLEAGAAEGWYSWHLIQEPLSKDFRVCSYDRAGFGYSDPRPGPRTVAGLLEDLHQLLERAGEKPPFVLVGHSLGGELALKYQRRYPAEVAALVLVDSSVPGARSIRPPEMQKLIDELNEKRPKQLAEWKKSGKWPEMWAPPKLPESLRREVLELSASQKWWEARYAEGRMPDAEEPEPEDRTIAVPLIVIASTKWDRPQGWSDATYDKYMAGRLALQKELASRAKHSELITADVSHHVHIDRPELVTDAIRRVARRSQE
jgi:pimeloyl-ACP methyl ester carboxylesterase